MLAWLSRLIDEASEFFARRKGLLPMAGILLVIANLALQFFPAGWLSESDLLLHLGVIVAIIGIMLAWAL